MKGNERMNIKPNDPNWRIYWGQSPLPYGAVAVGTVKRDTGETGALLLLASGRYVQGNARVYRTLDQRAVNAALRKE